MKLNPHYDLVPKDFNANLRFRRELLNMAGTDENAAREFRMMCRDDLLFYINAFCWTYSPKDKPNGQPVTPFITYTGFQDEALMDVKDCVDRGRDFVMPKSRDMGASWIGLTVFEWFWHFRTNLSFLLISRNEKYVDDSGNPKSLFWKIDFLHLNQPRWLLPPGRWLGRKDPERRLLHLGNAETQSVIDGESTTGEAGRGDRRTAMFIDEHAAFDVQDGFRVLRATRDTTDCRGFNSTPQGANNAFYEVVHNTAAMRIALHWSRHPLKNKGLYTADVRDKNNPKLVLRDDWRGIVEYQTKGEKESKWLKYPEEYPFKLDGKLRSPWYDLQCARCVSPMEIAQELDMDFLGSDYQFFDSEAIEILRQKYCSEPLLKGDLEYDDESCTPKRVTESKRGKLELWLDLDELGRVPLDRKFTMGCDVSAGTGASNSVASVVDRVTGEKIAVWRDSNTRPHPFAKQCVALARFFNNAFLNWDASGPTGGTFTKEIVKAGYGPIYYRRREKKVGQDLTDEPGLFLNPVAKLQLLEDYRDALGNHRFINRSDQGMKECHQFIRKGDSVEHSGAMNSQDPSGARTAHGDEVVADALACIAMTEQSRDKEPSRQEIPVGCLAWRMERRKQELASKVDCLGTGW